jgi:hypothetical protein
MKFSSKLLFPVNHKGGSMKYTAIIALAAAMMISASAPAVAKTSQQERMKECSAQAKGKTGEERKTFMKSCLSGNTAAPAPAAAAEPAMSKSGKKLTAQQQKFKECAAESKGKKGAEHKKFMSECLKKK